MLNETVERWWIHCSVSEYGLQLRNICPDLQKSTLVKGNWQFNPKLLEVFVIRMTLKACICVSTPAPPPLHQNTHNTLNTHSHTDASDHHGLLFCQTSDSASLPLADNCVRGDIFFSVFSGKGSVKLHSDVLKCQLKMKINNLGVEKVLATLLISTPPPDRLGMALGQSGDWRVGRLDLTAAGEVPCLNGRSFRS